MKYIGQPTPILDAVEKVTGEALYTNDLRFPGMLHGKVLTSPVAHARIRSIDTSKAGGSARGAGGHHLEGRP